MTRKRITKTHEQAEMERKKHEDDHTCPHCGYRVYTGKREVRNVGRFFIKFVYYDKYTCTKCGTEWEVDRD